MAADLQIENGLWNSQKTKKQSLVLYAAIVRYISPLNGGIFQ